MPVAESGRIVEVVPYDEAWAAMYQDEAEIVREALGKLVLEMHHIGSTAIPGMWAKPVIDILVVVLLMTLVGVLIIYFFAQLYNLREGEIVILPHVRLHTSALGAALFAVIAWGHRLAAFDLLYSPRGLAFGASYTDVHAELPALQAMFWLALIIAATLLANVILRRLWLPLIGVGVWMGVGLVVISMLPGLMQRYLVEPNEDAREAPYIEHKIRFTRQAYGLDDVDERDFGQIEPVTTETLRANQPSLQNSSVSKDMYNRMLKDLFER